MQASESGLRFWIHVTPKAKHASVGGTHGDALRVAVKAPPVDGKANAACVQALADALNLRRSEVEIDPAAKSRRKRVLVRGDAEDLGARLLALASSPALR